MPSPFSLKDMDKSVDRIMIAIENKEIIYIVGDYDVDGITSRVILSDFFEYINFRVEFITPDRFKDGYGISIKLIENIKVDVIITVDNGITSYDVAKYCKSNNIDLIITDHHIAPYPIDAFSVINPKQNDCNFAFKDICGAEVAWYLVAGLKNKLKLDMDMSVFLDLLAMAIIADVMPLVSLNRVLLIKALKVFNASTRVSILAIKEVLKKEEFSSEDIAFLVAPKINVAGRVENASLAIEFLQETDIEKAIIKFEYLVSLIQTRRDLEEHIMNTITSKINKDDDIIAIYDDGFHEGVLGIVASQVANKYKKIALIGNMTNGIIKMSARSYGDNDLYSLIESSNKHLLSFGGHKAAAGLSIKEKDFQDFTTSLNQNFKTQNITYNIDQNILGILPIDEVNHFLLNLLKQYEPYGQANEKPRFLLKNIKFLESKKVGEKKTSLKLSTRNKHGYLNMIMFKAQDIKEDIKQADIVCTINENIYKGNSYLSLYVEEIREV